MRFTLGESRAVIPATTSTRTSPAMMIGTATAVVFGSFSPREICQPLSVPRWMSRSNAARLLIVRLVKRMNLYRWKSASRSVGAIPASRALPDAVPCNGLNCPATAA